MELVGKNKVVFGPRTLYEAYFGYRNIFIDISMVVLSVVFMAIMANIRIPLWPVPITMQTFGVFLIAFFFGSRKGVVSILAYILAGVLGFGVFAGYKSGFAAIMGPTGGYIIGFLFAVFFVGYLIERGYGRTKMSVFVCMVIGNIIIYFFGLIGLRLYFQNASFFKILTMGLFPFLVGDFLKILGAVYLFPYLWKGSERFRITRQS